MTRWVWIIPVACVLGLGCGGRPAEKTAGARAGDGFPRTVTDSFGHQVTIPVRPSRVVSTAPSNTELLFAVGAGAQVVGVTTVCNYPPEAREREKVGGFLPKLISVERIAGLRPDLILTTGRIQQPLSENLRKLGLAVLSFDAHSLDEVIGNVRLVGEATGHDDEAGQLAANLESRLKRVRERTAAIPDARRPGVLFLVSDEPLMAAGPRTFAGQLLEWAGGRNVFADVDRQFPRVSEEEIVRRNPAVILVPSSHAVALGKEVLRKRPAWQPIDAVRTGRILAIDDDLTSRPGPRLLDGLERLADLLHPPS